MELQRVGHDLSDLAGTQQRIHLKILKICLISLEERVTLSGSGTWRQQPHQTKDSDVDGDRKKKIEKLATTIILGTSSLTKPKIFLALNFCLFLE